MRTYWIFNTFVPVLQLFILAGAAIYLLRSRWFRGFAGQMRVHISAKIHLDKGKYHILRNVTLPTDGGTTRIDQIIVSTCGVFVIETNNSRGWIFGDPHQARWTQKIFNYTKTFPNPLHQNDKRIKTLQSLLALNDQQIFSIVVFTGSSTFGTDMPDNVIHGTELIRYIRSKDHHLLFDADVKMILSKIEAERLAPSRKPAGTAVGHVRQIAGETRFRKHRFESEMAAPAAFNHDDRSHLIDNEPAFTDSWHNRSWRSEDVDPDFSDRAFQ